MKQIFNSRKALSTVVTTLIILVVSVLLAGVVTMYAINITSTRTQQEDLRLTKQKIWVFANGTAYAALSIDNVGGRDVIIDKIQVRGVEASWSSVHYLRLNSSFSTSLNPPTSTYFSSWSDFNYTDSTSGSFSTTSSDLPLASGDTMVIYIYSPDSINLNDIGTSVGITVFTENAQYYVECNVETSANA